MISLMEITETIAINNMEIQSRGALLQLGLIGEWQIICPLQFCSGKIISFCARLFSVDIYFVVHPDTPFTVIAHTMRICRELCYVSFG